LYHCFPVFGRMKKLLQMTVQIFKGVVSTGKSKLDFETTL